MNTLYAGKLGKIKGVPLPRKKGDFVYFIGIGDPASRCFKIGTSNDVLRRMKEHLKYYETKLIIIYWVSPPISKYTSLRVEDNMKGRWLSENIWHYLRNDRFIIPKEVEKVEIQIRKTYEIPL